MFACNTLLDSCQLGALYRAAVRLSFYTHVTPFRLLPMALSQLESMNQAVPSENWAPCKTISQSRQVLHEYSADLTLYSQCISKESPLPN